MPTTPVTWLRPFLLMGWATLWLTGCSPAPEAAHGAGAVRLDPTAKPYALLSEYGFFGPNQTPNAGVTPYDVITPLFSDYAFKARYVWMPDSLQASVDEEGEVQFPVGTALIKTFYYPADFRQPEAKHRLVETRLLVHTPAGWQASTYVWNDAQTDAELSLVGHLLPVSWIDTAGQTRHITYAAPNRNQCKSCHNRRNELLPLGLQARNLNRELVYPDGVAANQLSRWQQLGLLGEGNYATRWAPVAAWDDPAAPLHARALAYLDVNCGHCHRPDGPAHTTGLYLTYQQTENFRLGVCKPPVAAGKGSGGHRFGIVPGKPDSSILLYRMRTNDPGSMMPEIGRALPHAEGVALIGAWIAALEGQCGG